MDKYLHFSCHNHKSLVTLNRMQLYILTQTCLPGSLRIIQETLPDKVVTDYLQRSPTGKVVKTSYAKRSSILLRVPKYQIKKQHKQRQGDNLSSNIPTKAAKTWSGQLSNFADYQFILLSFLSLALIFTNMSSILSQPTLHYFSALHTLEIGNALMKKKNTHKQVSDITSQPLVLLWKANGLDIISENL